MRSVRSAVAAVVAAAAVLAVGVTAASAADFGTLLPGNVFFLKNGVAGLAAATSADQVTSGTYAPLPFTAVAVDAACPTGTASAGVYTRLESPAPESQWNEVPLGALKAPSTDSAGHTYLTGPFNSFKLAAIQNHLAGTGRALPVALVCNDANGATIAHFETRVNLAATTENSGTWSQVDPPTVSGGGTAVDTTTSLTATAVGTNLQLTATVSPPAATGTVTFADGETELGPASVGGGTATFTVEAPSAGLHQYRATFVPANPQQYNGSSAEIPVQVTVAPNGTITVTLVVPEAETDPGTVTLSVPTNAAVTLAGERLNGRVVASGTLPQIQVTDTHANSLLTEWQVNVQASDFTGGSGTIGAKYLGIAPATPVTVPLDGPYTVVQAGRQVSSFLDDSASTGLSQAQLLGEVVTKGRGVTTLGGQLNFAVDAAAAAGTYTSVITVTLVGG